jgi:hypothetical protein
LSETFEHTFIALTIYETLLSVQPHLAECVRPRAFQLRLAAHLISVLFYSLSRLRSCPFRDCVIKNLFQVRDAFLQQTLNGVGGRSG